MTRLRAVAFDLFGTLVHLPDPLLRRTVPRLLGVRGGCWIRLVRDTLLTAPLPDLEATARTVVRELAGHDDEALAARCAAAFREHLAGARAVPGAAATLRFLTRRGIRVGVVSNLTAAHREVLERTGLAPHLAAVVFSCDLGIAKPDPRPFLELARRLGVEPSEVLVVGDSAASDGAGARAAGMRWLLVGSPGMPTAAAAGWLRLGAEDGARPLLAPGMELPVGGPPLWIRSMVPVAEERQGRYNLVWVLETGGPKRSEKWYAKRFLDPAGAHLEAIARQVMRAAGLSTPDWRLLPDPEPVLLSRPAPGIPYPDTPPDPPLARELGRHMAFAYVFANADFRPRNAFLDRTPGRPPVVTMIDLEHCFLNLAIDPTRIGDGAWDGLATMSLEDAERRAARRVLTPATVRRARAAFFDVRTVPAAVIESFAAGFVETHRRLATDLERLCAPLAERLRREPPLVAGTRRYRRRLAPFDLADIRRRADEDPVRVLTTVLGDA